ncbi:MAG: rhodanese-like domain-containing protein [Campylobacterales bacterium]|nr:rhodanese-like domain-containing protein [Campylobacterales bacterium]
MLQQREQGEVDFLLIDIREPFEYNVSYIEGVDVFRPTSQFSSWAKEFLEDEKDKKLIFTCRTGNRSAQVQHILTRYGRKDCIDHIGGIVSYRGKIVAPK